MACFVLGYSLKYNFIKFVHENNNNNLKLKYKVITYWYFVYYTRFTNKVN